MKHTNEELDAQFKTLPQELQEAISAPENTEKLELIGEDFNLNLDQTGELGEEMGMVMMGFTLPQDFAKNIKERLGIDADTIEKITERINNDIFLPIRESLRKIGEQREEKEEVTLDRDQVLHEIENPTPVKTLTTQAPANETSPNLPAIETLSNLPGAMPSTNSLKTPSLVEQRLGTPMKSSAPQKTYATIDPYREPTN